VLDLSSTYLDCYRPLALERSGRRKGSGRLSRAYMHMHIGGL